MLAVNVTAMSLDELIAREWIATNHLGGYASSTVAGLNTRKYHGMLIASMAPPVRRMVILSRVEETVQRGKESWDLACSEYPGTVHPRGHELLRAFSPEPFPRWAYQADGWTIEKELQLLAGSNTVVLSYTLLGGAEPVELALRPLFAQRGIHELTFQWNGKLDAEDRSGCASLHRIPPTSKTPEAFFAHDGDFKADGVWYLNTIYRRERERGYAGLEDLWMPGIVRYTLKPGQRVCFACSTDPIDLPCVVADAANMPRTTAAPALVSEITRPDPALDLLTRAADKFIVNCAGESGVLTGLPWSAPSVRETLMAFSGLFLVTRRFGEGAKLLRSLAQKLNAGLIPTEFPEDGGAALYDGADTSLWLIHAVHQYLRYTENIGILTDGLYDVCAKIVQRYHDGTAGLGIRCDDDGLISSRVPGLGTTWMDAKVGDWVITPRQGRPIELNALWYNALRVVSRWSDELDQHRRADELGLLADRLKPAFNAAFWNEAEGCCHDVVMDHGTDASIRPNQLLAISLPHPILDDVRFEPVLRMVRQKLLTPFGLRTLVAEDPSYQGSYRGDIVSRDRAYHQGSAYPWLLGPWVTAMLRLHGRTNDVRATCAELLGGCLEYLAQDGLGQLCELFDGDTPHNPGGAIASALSVGELLRCYVEDILNLTPETLPTGAKLPQLRPPVHR